MSQLLVNLAAALIPKLLKSKEARDDAKKKAKDAVSDIPTTTAGILALGGGGSVASGTTPVTGDPQIDAIIGGVLALIGLAWMKYNPKETADGDKN